MFWVLYAGIGEKHRHCCLFIRVEVEKQPVRGAALARWVVMAMLQPEMVIVVRLIAVLAGDTMAEAGVMVASFYWVPPNSTLKALQRLMKRE